MKGYVKVILLLFMMMLSFRVSLAHSKTCEVYDGKYYGKDGYEVDKVQYEIECLPHSCEIVGDKYFSKNGSIVSYEAYKNECESTMVVTPSTGSDVSPIYILFMFLGSGLIIGTIFFLTSFKHSYNQ